MRIIVSLLTLMIICQPVYASNNNSSPAMRAMEEENPLFEPVSGMYAGMNEVQLRDAQQKKSVEVNSYQKLIGDAKVDELTAMLKSAKSAKKAGCVIGWTSKGLAGCVAITTALGTALGAPSWVFYVTASGTAVVPVIAYIADYLKEDAAKTKKEVIKCYANSIKELEQINALLHEKEAVSRAQGETKMLALKVNRIHEMLATGSGDVALDMEALEEEGDSKGKEDDVKRVSPPPAKKGKLTKRKKGSKGTVPPKVAPKQTDPQGAAPPLVSAPVTDAKLEEVPK